MQEKISDSALGTMEPETVQGNEKKSGIKFYLHPQKDYLEKNRKIEAACGALYSNFIT